MRHFRKLVEGLLPPLYHGSQRQFAEGFILLPQSDGYVHTEANNPAHAMLERIAEKYRPDHCIPRGEAVFMVANPDEIDFAGGYNDHVYLVEPDAEVHRCNLNWYSTLYALCEHEALSAQEAKAMGREWYPDWEESEAEEYALNYWNGLPKDDGDLYEYLTRSARIIREI